MTATSTTRGMGPSQRRRAKVWGAAVLIVLLAAGGWLLTHRGGVHYITATPTMSTVQETVSLSGTVAPQQEDDMNFGASGTVASVAVSAGQTVKAGQTLATLQPASLEAALAEAEAQLAEAKATLATDQAGGNNTTASTVANDKAQLSSAEASVTADQTIDNVKLAQAEAAVTAAEDQLASDRSEGASAAVISKDEAAVVSAQQNETLTKAQDQQSLSQAEAQVTADQNQLTTAEQQASAEAPVAAAQLQAASATVTSDEQTVADDQAALADATLKAPYAGTIQAVNITAGQTVGGGGAAADPSSGASAASSSASSSSTADIVLVGNGNYAIDADASETEVGELQVGEQATITLTSAAAPVYGTVAQVASEAVDSSGVSEFPIVIDVTGHPTGLLDGDTVDVSVLVKEASDVLTVPTSAVHTLGSRSYVTVMNPSGGTKLQTVTVGLEGTTLTQIKSGLTTHDTVVLATTNAVVPGITGTTGRFGGAGFGGGGFGGGGFGGGGFGGGGFGGGGFGGGGFGGGGG